MTIPKTREEARETSSAHLWDTPPHWPRHIHLMTTGAFEYMGIDPRDNRLYWDGVPIVTKNTVRLEGWSFALAFVATLATVVSAMWPVLLHFGLFAQNGAP